MNAPVYELAFIEDNPPPPPVRPLWGDGMRSASLCIRDNALSTPRQCKAPHALWSEIIQLSHAEADRACVGKQWNINPRSIFARDFVNFRSPAVSDRLKHAVI